MQSFRDGVVKQFSYFLTSRGLMAVCGAWSRILAHQRPSAKTGVLVSNDLSGSRMKSNKIVLGRRGIPLHLGECQGYDSR